MSLAALVVAAAVVATGSLVQGAAGFGLSLFAAPLLTLIDPALVPGPLLIAGLALPALTALRERASVDLRAVRWAVVGRVPGALVAAGMLAVLPREETAFVVGLVVLGAVLITLSGVRVEPTDRALFGAGVVSGFMGTTAAIGGPVVALLYQDAEGPRLRGTLAGYFVVAAAISIVVLALVGRFGRVELLAGLALLPGVALGFLASGPASRVLDRGYTRSAVLAVSALGAVALLVRTVRW